MLSVRFYLNTPTGLAQAVWLTFCFCRPYYQEFPFFGFTLIIVMAADDGETIFGSPSSPHDVDETDSFFQLPEEEPSARRSGGRMGRPRDPADGGKVGVWVVDVEPWWWRRHETFDACERRKVGNCYRCLRGLAVLEWRYQAADVRDAAAPGVWGKVSYSFSQFWDLAPPVEPLLAHVYLSLATTPLWFEEQFGDNFLVTANMRVAEFLSSQEVHFGKVMSFYPKDMDWVQDEDGKVPLPGVLLKHGVGSPDLFASTLGMSLVRAWRRRIKNERIASVDTKRSRSDEVLVELPKRYRASSENIIRQNQSNVGNKEPFDPLKLMNAVGFGLHFRQSGGFQEALLAAKRYEEDDFVGDVDRSGVRDPAQRTLSRSACRLDVVGMAIERRLWHAEVIEDSVLAINCYSDSSPVVGFEIQGMCVDVIHKDGSRRIAILPGGSVFYGMQDAMNNDGLLVGGVASIRSHSQSYEVLHLTCYMLDLRLRS